MNDRCHQDCRCQLGQDWEDVSFLTDWLAVGGQVHDYEIEDLRRLGITHVINVNWPDRPEYPEIVAAFHHLDLSILDDGEPKPASWFAAGIEFARSLGSGDRLLVHCGHGVNRSPAMAYAILRSSGLAPGVAEAVLRERRPQTGSGKTGGAFEVYRQSAEAAVR